MFLKLKLLSSKLNPSITELLFFYANVFVDLKAKKKYDDSVN